jgi:ATP-dependent RNA helicase RhlE
MSNMSFTDLGVSDAVVRTLSRRGFNEPFPIQRLVIGEVLAGHDVLAKSPTGSGKTLAFAIPLVERLGGGPTPAALVLAPTRELASQIVEDTRPLARARGLQIAAVYGGTGMAEQIRKAPRAQIIVATPGRLEDLLERKVISLGHVRFLVLDEADRMLDMGFKPSVDRIVRLCPAKRQTLFFSATLEGEVLDLARAYTRNPVRREHAPAAQRTTATQHRFIAVERADRIDALVEELRADRDLALVFVRTKRGADRLVKRLRAEGVSALAMHGDKSQPQREKALAAFESGRVDTLVATDVAARGIHVADISHVINFDPPKDREGYVHRVGRTGRAGRTGVGITFVGAEQTPDVRRIAAQLKLHDEFRDGVGSRRDSTGPHRKPAGRHNGASRPRRHRPRRSA